MREPRTEQCGVKMHSRISGKTLRPMVKSLSKAHLAVLFMVAASIAVRCYLPSRPHSSLQMHAGESQYHSRLAIRLLEDGPFAYSGWVDGLSMYPSANRPSVLQPPGSIAFAAAAVFVERLFSHSSHILVYIAPAVHAVFMLVM